MVPGVPLCHHSLKNLEANKSQQILSLSSRMVGHRPTHNYVRLSNVGSGDLNSEEQALLLTELPPQPTTKQGYLLFKDNVVGLMN